jgi:hypothetical protein
VAFSWIHGARLGTLPAVTFPASRRCSCWFQQGSRTWQSCWSKVRTVSRMFQTGTSDPGN